ncbi:hypothetical protein NDU88_007278 [Pleurodeles waltl]|uniref:Uncharacterized protein n=1 Tax=Pleurodeles waltl TaxID=8319 RepID=A0AAV7PNI9_PLEWA|nr:hypothetical protein NDU88_007278 [Pleurodeles waltl]
MRTSSVTPKNQDGGRIGKPALLSEDAEIGRLKVRCGKDTGAAGRDTNRWLGVLCARRRQLPLGNPRSTRLGNRDRNEGPLTEGLASASGERRGPPRMRAESLPGHGDVENLSD